MDTIDSKARSRVMASVRSKGNRSTERKLRSILIHSGIRSWRIQAKDLPGIPDFAFNKAKLVIFVDGCFWHGCPYCYRRPHSSQEYWDRKVERNKKRDKQINSKLRRQGWSVMRIWEHSLNQPVKIRNRIIKRLTILENK